MKDLEVGDNVNVRGMEFVHEVVSVIGRTRQVHLRCLVTGHNLEYVDVSALSIVPVFNKPELKEINGIGLGDTVVPAVKANSVVEHEYTVVGINLSTGTYDLCNNTTKKVVKGVRRACQGRNVSDDALKRLAHEVEQIIRAEHGSLVQTNQIGLAILDPLRNLDEVAYLRFASVYKSFDSAEDFEQEIESLRAHRARG